MFGFTLGIILLVAKLYLAAGAGVEDGLWDHTHIKQFTLTVSISLANKPVNRSTTTAVTNQIVWNYLTKINLMIIAILRGKSNELVK